MKFHFPKNWAWDKVMRYVMCSCNFCQWIFSFPCCLLTFNLSGWSQSRTKQIYETVMTAMSPRPSKRSFYNFQKWFSEFRLHFPTNEMMSLKLDEVNNKQMKTFLIEFSVKNFTSSTLWDFQFLNNFQFSLSAIAIHPLMLT